MLLDYEAALAALLSLVGRQVLVLFSGVGVTIHLGDCAVQGELGEALSRRPGGADD